MLFKKFLFFLIISFVKIILLYTINDENNLIDLTDDLKVDILSEKSKPKKKVKFDKVVDEIDLIDLTDDCPAKNTRSRTKLLK